MSSVDVSVIVPVYNSAAYLREALDSVQRQSAAAEGEASIELIVVDDGSTDESMAVLDKWKQQNAAFALTTLRQSNSNPATARNVALTRATGDYIVFLDADDYWLPDKLKSQLAILRGNPKLGAVHSGWTVVDSAGKTLATIQPWLQSDRLDLLGWLLHKPIRLGAMMFRRDWLHRVDRNGDARGPFDAKLQHAEDTDLILRLSSAGCRFDWYRESTMAYRQNPSGLVAGDPIGHAQCNADAVDKLYATPGMPRTVKSCEAAIRYYMDSWNAWHLASAGELEQALVWLRASTRWRRLTRNEFIVDWEKLFEGWRNAALHPEIDKDDLDDLFEKAAEFIVAPINGHPRLSRAIRSRIPGLFGRRSPHNDALPGTPPVASAITPDSVLSRHRSLSAESDGATPDEGSAPQELFINQRQRLATCSAAGWFHGSYLATGNVYPHSIHTYFFDEHSSTLSLVQSLPDLPGVECAESLAISPDGRLLAIGDLTRGAAHLFAMDVETHRVSERPLLLLDDPEDEHIHGIAFSPCSRFLAYTSVDQPGLVRLFRILYDGKRVTASPLPAFRLRDPTMRPKGIDFSPDGKNIVICYCPNASVTCGPNKESRLEMYAFDPVLGINPRPLARASTQLELGVSEDVRFFPSGEHLLITEQASDRATIVAWDRRHECFGARLFNFEPASSGLSFPHGASISPDGRHFAITNYGDDRVSVFETPADHLTWDTAAPEHLEVANTKSKQ